MAREYVIWGKPPGKDEEHLLNTRAQSMKEALSIKSILEKEHECSCVRIQVLDIEKDDIAALWGVGSVKKIIRI